MRVYSDAYELMSEIFREVWEMGHIVHPNTMQNKVVKDDENFETREIFNYSYCLTSLKKAKFLFFADNQAMEWAQAELEERVSPLYVNPGNAWKLRKRIWEEFINEDGRFDYSYNERMFKSLRVIIRELGINPDSRQAIVSIWDPTKDIDGIGGKRRVPCSMYYQFMIRNNQLNVIYSQRSADVVTHFGNDVFLAFKLMEFVAISLGVKPGYLFHNIGSLHSYRKDWPILKQCIEGLKL